jgi:hypothetical protein
MSSWTHFCRRAPDLEVGDGWVDVSKDDSRRHRVNVREIGDAYVLHGIVARKAVVNALTDLELRVWRINRATQIVGFRITEKDTLIGEAHVPKLGLTSEEFLTYLRKVATECDQLEYQLTGKDSE